MASAMTAPVIVWLRQDLRLADNPALADAARLGAPVIPVYVFDETAGVRPLGGAARWWLHGSIAALDDALAARGSRLILRRGPAVSVLRDLVQESGAGTVIWNRLYDPGAVARDTAVKQVLAENGVEARSHNAGLLNEPWAVKTGAGGPYRVFTPYWRAARPLIDGDAGRSAPAHIVPPDRWPASDVLKDWRLRPASPDWATGFSDWTPGEAGARATLERFLDNAAPDYPRTRDLPGAEGVSLLSPYLRWGEIGPRQVVAAVLGAEARGALPSGSAETFLKELGWREFNHHLLFHFPRIETDNFNPTFDAFPWSARGHGLAAWRRGATGYPIVDAGMRQLWTTGWMHNRVRMIVASFLTKHLGIHWRTGEAWFWDTLVDADAANNACNWQWVAGSGADASPYFRIFNPTAQGERFDPHGAYVRRWVPEAAKLPDSLIHQPWSADSPPRGYPPPIVDHAAARAAALAAYATLKHGESDSA